METSEKMRDLELRHKAALGLRSAAFMASGVSAVAFGLGGETALAALACAAFAALGGMAWRSAHELGRDLREQALAEALQGALASQEAARVQAEQERERIAGIEFHTPAGVFDGETVYRFAMKNGSRYEYVGLATADEEPSEELLIVNDLAYRRAATA
jgi:hypothetical protein